MSLDTFELLDLLALAIILLILLFGVFRGPRA